MKKGGGNKAVAQRAGLKLSNLNNYLRGVHRVPADAAGAVATACHVSIDWLLRGEGRMDYPPLGQQPDGTLLVQGPTMDLYNGGLLTEEPKNYPRLELVTNFDRLAEAVLLADEVFAATHQNPSGATRANAYILTYDALAATTADNLRIVLGVKSLIPKPTDAS